MGLLDLYRIRKPERDRSHGDVDEEKPEPLPRIGLNELWPPSPRVKLLYIGVGFFLFNLTLICIWGIILMNQMR
jgi:hypothetical protein